MKLTVKCRLPSCKHEPFVSDRAEQMHYFRVHDRRIRTPYEPGGILNGHVSKKTKVKEVKAKRSYRKKAGVESVHRADGSTALLNFCPGCAFPINKLEVALHSFDKVKQYKLNNCCQCGFPLGVLNSALRLAKKYGSL